MMLRQDVGVEKQEGDGGDDPEGEASEVQSRMDGASVAEAGKQKGHIRQNCECKSPQGEDFRPEHLPAPTGRRYGYEGEHGGAQRDYGSGGNGVATCKAHVGVQENKQEGDRILDQHDSDDKNTMTSIYLAEQARHGKEDRRDEGVGGRGDTQRNENLLARANTANFLCGSCGDISGHGNDPADYTAGQGKFD